MILFPDIQPEIFSFSIFGMDIALRWYALSYIVGFIFALYIMKFFLRRKKLWANQTAPMEEEDADNILTYLIIGVILGGRLGYVLFYNAPYYVLNPIDVFRVWDGGMSFHGGFVGVIVAVVFYCRRNGILLFSCADLIALATPPGLFLGRIANFINAELWGRPTSMPWGVVFPGEMAQICPQYVGLCARHPSQIYEAILEGLLLLLILCGLAFLGYLRRPGFLFGTFFVSYGVARYFVEHFRVPDPQFVSQENPLGFAFQFSNFGLTMGQLLSIPMIVIGSVIMLWALNLGNEDKVG